MNVLRIWINLALPLAFLFEDGFCESPMQDNESGCPSIESCDKEDNVEMAQQNCSIRGGNLSVISQIDLTKHFSLSGTSGNSLVGIQYSRSSFCWLQDEQLALKIINCFNGSEANCKEQCCNKNSGVCSLSDFVYSACESLCSISGTFYICTKDQASTSSTQAPSSSSDNQISSTVCSSDINQIRSTLSSSDIISTLSSSDIISSTLSSSDISSTLSSSDISSTLSLSDIISSTLSSSDIISSTLSSSDISSTLSSSDISSTLSSSDIISSTLSSSDISSTLSSSDISSILSSSDIISSTLSSSDIISSTLSSSDIISSTLSSSDISSTLSSSDIISSTLSSSDIISSTLSSSDIISSTLSSSDIISSTLSSSDIISSTLSSSDISSTLSSSDIISSTLSSSDIISSTLSSSDIISSTLSSSDIISSTLSLSDINQISSSLSSSDFNQLKSTPLLSDNQIRSILSSALFTEPNVVVTPTKASPIDSSKSRRTSPTMWKQRGPYEKLVKSVDTNNTNALSKLINITSNYIEVLGNDNVTNKQRSSLEICDIFERLLTDYAKKHLHNGSLTRNTLDFVIKMEKVSSSKKDKQDLIFPQSEDAINVNTYATQENFIVIPKELISTDSIFVGVLYYTLDKILIANSESEKLNTKIISAEISPKPTGTLKRNITFTLRHRNRSGLESNCVFIQYSSHWNTSFSTTGCSVLFTNDSHTTCTCDHMTSFAVLTRFRNPDTKPIPEAHSKALSVITYVGITLSLVGEILTVASYVFLIGLKTEQAHLHTNLALSLGLAQVFFLVVIHLASLKPCCVVMTSLVHYFYLTTFCWMVCEGFHLYLMVVKVFTEESYLKEYYLFSWITPLAIVVVSIVLAASTPGGVYKYISEDICWLSTENNYIWSFLGPVLLVCLINLVLLYLVVKEMTKMNKSKDVPSIELRKSVKACLLLFPILGTTWLLCVLTIASSSLAVEYIFNIFNSLQGFFIFLFHVVRNSEIRTVFQRKRNQWGTSFDMSNNNISTLQKTQMTNRNTTPPASAGSVKPVLGNWIEKGERESPDLFYSSNRSNQVMPAVEATT